MINSTFSSKYIADGKLSRRKHGYDFIVTASGLTIFEILVPYTMCKLDAVEIIGCEIGDYADFKVLDDDLGTISTTPKAVLAQYGYEVRLTKDFYRDNSKYAADLFGGAYLQITYYNNNSVDKTICVNLDLHEVL